MSVELYVLLKFKGSYNHSRKEKWIYGRLEEPDTYSHDSMIYQCKNNNYIESHGEHNRNSGFQHRDLFLTPYGEKRLNRLEAEYMKEWRKSFLSLICKILGAVGTTTGILSYLSGCLK